jgi:hypothetical protein
MGRIGPGVPPPNRPGVPPLIVTWADKDYLAEFAKDIAALKALTYVNLTNTKVTDAGFAQVAALPQLKELYVWGTAITAPAIDKAKAARKDVIIYAGLKASDVKPETKIVAPTN